MEIDECFAKNGKIIHSKSNRSLSYGELANIAANINPSSEPKLKNVDKYQIIGKSSQKSYMVLPG